MKLQLRMEIRSSLLQEIISQLPVTIKTLPLQSIQVALILQQQMANYHNKPMGLLLLVL
ncbi:hypothetical protein SVR5_00527 [Glaesserella parasuis 29755]|nr:hypothetical protein SVR5_00527 [Glaesserella parasuis 29755]